MFTLVVLIVFLVASAHAEQPARPAEPKFAHKPFRYGEGAKDAKEAQRRPAKAQA